MRELKHRCRHAIHPRLHRPARHFDARRMNHAWHATDATQSGKLLQALSPARVIHQTHGAPPSLTAHLLAFEGGVEDGEACAALCAEQEASGASAGPVPAVCEAEARVKGARKGSCRKEREVSVLSNSGTRGHRGHATRIQCFCPRTSNKMPVGRVCHVKLQCLGASWRQLGTWRASSLHLTANCMI